MIRTFRILSALLQYPSAELQEAVPKIAAALGREGLLTDDGIALLEPLLAFLGQSDLIETQEAYVELFDRGRAHSLHLFEHVHGESRDRGQAMVDLRERYLAAGLDPVSNELPDFLPQFLEYCSMLPVEKAREQLAEPGVVLVALAERLEKRGSPYAAVLIALCELADVERTNMAQASVVPADDPDDLEALDAAWEAEEVTFGGAGASPSDSGCPQAAAIVHRFAQPASSSPARSL